MKNWMKKLSVCFMALIMVVGLASCGGDSDKVYKVGMEATFPPFDMTDKDGELDGFDVDFMNAIAEDQGFKVEFVSLGFDGLIPGLESENIDIVASGMWAKESRKEKVDFSETYYDSGVTLAVKNDNTTIKDVADLPKDAVVAAQIGTSSEDLGKKLKKEGKIADVKVYDKVNDAFLDLQNGAVTALLNDKPVTQYYMSQQPDKVKIVGDNLTVEGYGIAVKKENKELLDKINAGIKNLKDNGKYEELLEKWGLNL